MEKQIVRLTYWLGLLSAAVALLWRGVNTLGIGMANVPTPGMTITYLSFYKAALLFLLLSVASAQLTSSQK